MKEDSLERLQSRLEGELRWDRLSQVLYATDASVYRRIPLAVATPKHAGDIRDLIEFCTKEGVSLIPRAAGTSLAGQCVGEGIVVDVSRHMTRILDYDPDTARVTVEPGVVRDDLNRFLYPYGRFFGPNTSTANRCMMGGMVGNNSSGTTSIRYGVTRDKVHSLKMLLSNGEEIVCEPLNSDEFNARKTARSTEGKILSALEDLLSLTEVGEEIRREFPKAGIHRRNTGYAIDELLRMQPLDAESELPFNLAKLVSGSEGTLGFITEITLETDLLPPQLSALVATHYTRIGDCLEDVAPLMETGLLFTCEMMDKVILDCTRDNLEQRENRRFVEGDPAAILLLEVRAETPEELEEAVRELLHGIKQTKRSYAHPILRDDEVTKAFELRKAGLGLLANIPGDAKAVACIEDTAVLLEDLAPFIEEFGQLMKRFGQEAVYYAHAGAGEIHLRPILNLKKSSDVELFREITRAVALLTKRYGGSFSGEHGDGIVRAEFIPEIIGAKNYELLRDVKRLFDPMGIFNPGKIVDPYPMDKGLRYEPDRFEWVLDTFMDFRDTEGYLRAAEKCNGSGDCRKTNDAGGGMCPSYRATLDEKDSTRARANALREFITQTPPTENPYKHKELKEVLDLCISCKACARECPSNVDMSVLKSEFLYQYQRATGFSFRSRLFAHSTKLNALASLVAPLANGIYGSRSLSFPLKEAMGIAPGRSLPKVHRTRYPYILSELSAYYSREGSRKTRVALYIDEFSRYMDRGLGREAIDLLLRLGFDVQLFYGESGRAFISKGFLKQARQCALTNLRKLSRLREQGIPLVGIEPSAILSFSDEYRRLAPKTWSEDLVSQVYLIEEFLLDQYQKGVFGRDRFTREEKKVKIHVHCHQKALRSPKTTFDLLNIPENYVPTLMATGCCGMAGSFGYEKEHFAVSMKIGELGLFPSVRKAGEEVLIAANGTSCRHQIEDGTSRKARHPLSILREALLP